MPSVNLDQNEWRVIMQILATQVVWQTANPLLVKITEQLNGAGLKPSAEEIAAVKGNSGERHTDERSQ